MWGVVRRSVVAVIPARLASTRLSRKMLRPLAGKPLIEHVWRRVMKCSAVADVVVATDSKEIAAVVTDFGGRALMTSRKCASGTDRVSEALEMMGAWGAVNVQGDEPFISPASVDRLATALSESDGKSVYTLVRATRDSRAAQAPDVVKAVVTADGRAQYFSRAAVPFARAKGSAYFEHVGVYAYTRTVLRNFVTWGPSQLERRERLEQLRFLEHDVTIRVLKTKHKSIGIDTMADLRMASARMKRGSR
jgi:3-deoxy-manno-octulosonate cytidylyltransferase (CMP-KDO synthetase)